MYSASVSCPSGHITPDLYNNRKEFEDLLGAKKILCGRCTSPHVTANLAAPSVNSGRSRLVADDPTAPPPSLKESQQGDNDGESLVAFVGASAPDEIRRVVAGTSEIKAPIICGFGTVADVQSLRRDGIDVHAGPLFPRSELN